MFLIQHYPNNRRWADPSQICCIHIDSVEFDCRKSEGFLALITPIVKF